MHDIMNNNFTWGVFIILPVWLVYPPCQTTAPHGSQPAPPGRSSRGQCGNTKQQDRNATPTPPPPRAEAGASPPNVIHLRPAVQAR
uniref:Conotoxin superfamily Z n=1 Tax=Conus ermineus TaxID=55423 RepID=A0A346CJH2_CONER|nr:conotoxin precursor superfamily Z [Conus ermineus]